MDPPGESKLRKYYLPKCYEETINKIRKLCENENIWVSFDETSSGRKIVNIIIGVLKDDDVRSEKFFLLACEEISVVNHTTVACVYDAMHILWPRGVKYDNVLLLLTDAAPYMIKAGEALSVSYPKMITLRV